MSRNKAQTVHEHNFGLIVYDSQITPSLNVELTKEMNRDGILVLLIIIQLIYSAAIPTKLF